MFYGVTVQIAINRYVWNRSWS